MEPGPAVVKGGMPHAPTLAWQPAPASLPPGCRVYAVGDVHGLLVLVTPGRPWLPTRDRLADVVPTTVEAVVGRTTSGVHALGERSRLTVVG